MARSVAGAAPGRLNRKFLVVAVLLATLSATLIYAGLSSRRSSSSSSGSAGSQPVVVAKTSIKQRTTITADMLDVKEIGQDAVSAGAFGSVDSVIGKVTKFPIEANQQVLSSAVVDTTKPSADALAPLVPDKRRGFSIKATQVLTAGGLLLPGDYVDVVWVCCPGGLDAQGTNGQAFKTTAYIFARPVVQNVQVAAVQQEIVSSGPVGGSSAGGNPTDNSNNPVAADAAKKTPDATTITLLVTPEQADVLLLAEGTGELRAALRNPGDSATVPSPNDTQFFTPGLIPADLMRFIIDTYTTKNATP